MEYAAPVWDPYYNGDIYKLEKVQRRATRWIQSDYSRTTSVTSLLSYIDISTLEQRRQSSRLVLLYKIINNLLPISIPTYYQHTQFHTRQHHTQVVITLSYHKPHSILISIVFIQEQLKIGITCQ